MSTLEGLLSIGEAAQHLGVSAKTVRRWIQAGRLPAQKEKGPYGDQYWVPVEAIQAAQHVLDVVKVERPTDPRTLALAVAQALEEREAALREELKALRHQIAALDMGQTLVEQNLALQGEVAELRRQVAHLTSAIEQVAARLTNPAEVSTDRQAAPTGRRRWWPWGKK